MAARERAKGHAFERTVAKRIREALPFTGAKRGLQYQGGGADVADVMAPPLWIECKARKSVNIKGAFADVRKHCPREYLPAAVTKDDGKATLVTMEISDFLEVVHDMAEELNRAR